MSNVLVLMSAPVMPSFKQTKQGWHTSSLLAYAPIPNPQDDFDSITSKVKFTANTETDFYDRSLTRRTYALIGVACSSFFSISCIIAGIVIIAIHGRDGTIQFPFYSD